MYELRFLLILCVCHFSLRIIGASVHFLHGNPVGYNIEFFEGFIKVAQDAGLDEIYMLEHTHQFTEFERVYEPIKAYNDFQNNWITKRMNGSIDEYIRFIK